MKKRSVVKLTTTPADAQRSVKFLERQNPGKKYAFRHETGRSGEKADVTITEV